MHPPSSSSRSTRQRQALSIIHLCFDNQTRWDTAGSEKRVFKLFRIGGVSTRRTVVTLQTSNYIQSFIFFLIKD